MSEPPLWDIVEHGRVPMALVALIAAAQCINVWASAGLVLDFYYHRLAFALAPLPVRYLLPPWLHFFLLSLSCSMVGLLQWATFQNATVRRFGHSLTILYWAVLPVTIASIRLSWFLWRVACSYRARRRRFAELSPADDDSSLDDDQDDVYLLGDGHLAAIYQNHGAGHPGAVVPDASSLDALSLPFQTAATTAGGSLTFGHDAQRILYLLWSITNEDSKTFLALISTLDEDQQQMALRTLFQKSQDDFSSLVAAFSTPNLQLDSLLSDTVSDNLSQMAQRIKQQVGVNDNMTNATVPGSSRLPYQDDQDLQRQIRYLRRQPPLTHRFHGELSFPLAFLSILVVLVLGLSASLVFLFLFLDVQHKFRWSLATPIIFLLAIAPSMLAFRYFLIRPTVRARMFYFGVVLSTAPLGVAVLATSFWTFFPDAKDPSDWLVVLVFGVSFVNLAMIFLTFFVHVHLATEVHEFNMAVGDISMRPGGCRGVVPFWVPETSGQEY